MAERPEDGPPRPVPGPLDGSDAPRYAIETSPRRVRVMLGGEFVADTTGAVLLFESGRLPVYYFPRSDVRPERLVESGVHDDAVKGRTLSFDVKVGGRVAERAAWRCDGHPGHGPALDHLIAFDWSQMDAWFEEDEEVFVHPRDPYTRVDAIESSRHVVVSIDGVAVADSRRPVMVFETGLPTRYYLAKTDVRLELLEASETRTACPYKGTARYWDVRTKDRLAEDLVWCYETPIPEMPKIAGRLCFYNEKVDLDIDGEREERPRTKWS